MLVFERKIKGYPSPFSYGRNGEQLPHPVALEPYWVPPWVSNRQNQAQGGQRSQGGFSWRSPRPRGSLLCARGPPVMRTCLLLCARSPLLCARTALLCALNGLFFG